MVLIEGISGRGDNRLLRTYMDINIADNAKHFKNLSSVVSQVQLILNAYQLSASTHKVKKCNKIMRAKVTLLLISESRAQPAVY